MVLDDFADDESDEPDCCELFDEQPHTNSAETSAPAARTAPAALTMFFFFTILHRSFLFDV